MQKKMFANHPLLFYSCKRIFYGFITLIFAISFWFVLLRIATPNSIFIGDIDLAKANIAVGSEEYNDLLAARMKIYNVDGSIFSQLLRYLKNIAFFIKKEIPIDNQWDPITRKIEVITKPSWFFLGNIVSSQFGVIGSEVTSLFPKRMYFSFLFGGLALFFSYLIGIPLGIVSARYKEKKMDKTISIVAIVLNSIPVVVLVAIGYIVALMVFGSKGLFISGGVNVYFWPIFLLFLLNAPRIILDTRRYMIDEINESYVNFALSKGMSAKYVFVVHIFRNAGIRILYSIPVMFILTIFGASIFVERAWSIPGMSDLLVTGVFERDLFVIMGYTVLSATVGIFTTLLADLIIVIMDPRVRLTKKKLK